MKPCSARRGKRCRRRCRRLSSYAHGPVVDRLLDELRQDHYDLIVVGSRGRGRLRSALFGGLGQKLARQSPVPVLVVPVPTTDVRDSERGRGRELGLLRGNRPIVTGAPLHEAHVCQPTCTPRRRGVPPTPPSRRIPRHTQSPQPKPIRRNDRAA